MILEEIAEVMSGQTPSKISRKTGLSRMKINRMAQAMPFNLDYNVIYALHRMGYHLELVENSVEMQLKIE